MATTTQPTTSLKSTPPKTTPRKAPPVDRTIHVTRSLLGYGVLAGPFFTVVSLAQVFTRDGFDPLRHPWSLLANGGPGWIQVANFVLTGLMTVAAAVGLRRALEGGRGAAAVPPLVGGYGVGLIGSGVFRADPAMGFPAGAPEHAAGMTLAGTLHFAVGGIGFACLIAACLVLAGRFAREGRRGWAASSRLTGALFAAGFLGVASGAATVAATLGFAAAVVLGWAWLAAVSADLYRRQYDLMTGA
jgi:hypothetical protein